MKNIIKNIFNKDADTWVVEPQNYAPVTEEDWESVTVLQSPRAIEVRRRWQNFKPNRKIVGYR